MQGHAGRQRDLEEVAEGVNEPAALGLVAASGAIVATGGAVVTSSGSIVTASGTIVTASGAVLLGLDKGKVGKVISGVILEGLENTADGDDGTIGGIHGGVGHRNITVDDGGVGIDGGGGDIEADLGGAGDVGAVARELGGVERGVLGYMVSQKEGQDVTTGGGLEEFTKAGGHVVKGLVGGGKEGQVGCSRGVIQGALEQVSLVKESSEVGVGGVRGQLAEDSIWSSVGALGAARISSLALGRGEDGTVGGIDHGILGRIVDDGGGHGRGGQGEGGSGDGSGKIHSEDG